MFADQLCPLCLVLQKFAMQINHNCNVTIKTREFFPDRLNLYMLQNAHFINVSPSKIH